MQALQASGNLLRAWLAADCSAGLPTATSSRSPVVTANRTLQGGPLHLMNISSVMLATLALNSRASALCFPSAGICVGAIIPVDSCLSGWAGDLT